MFMKLSDHLLQLSQHISNVAKAVKTRSPKQCWLYYQRMVLPREAWKPVEYHRLFHLVTKFRKSSWHC